MGQNVILSLLACASLMALGGCTHKGPAQRAGEKVDHTVDTIKNGGEEPTRDKLQDEADRAGDKVNEAAEDAKKHPPG